MDTNKLSGSIDDEHQIAGLLVRWGHARDSDEERALRDEGKRWLENA